MAKPFVRENPNLDEPHVRRVSRVSGGMIRDVAVPLVSPRIIKQRQKNWEAFFRKYSQENPDDKVLNLETLEIEDNPGDLSTSHLPPQLPKPASEVQYWVDTGKFPSIATTGISQPLSISLSLSRSDPADTSQISIKQPAADGARISKGIPCNKTTSSVSSINTIAYLLASATTTTMKNNLFRPSQATRRSNPINNSRVRRSRATRKSRVASDQVSRLLTTIDEAADSSKFSNGDYLNDACESNNIRTNDLSWKTERAKENFKSVKDKSNIASFRTVDVNSAELVENKSSSETPFDSILERSNLVRKTRKLFTQPDSIVDVHSPIHNSFSRCSAIKFQSGHPALHTPTSSLDGSVVRESQFVANSRKLRRLATSQTSVKRPILPEKWITDRENVQHSEKTTGISGVHTVLVHNGIISNTAECDDTSSQTSSARQNSMEFQSTNQRLGMAGNCKRTLSNVDDFAERNLRSDEVFTDVQSENDAMSTQSPPSNSFNSTLSSQTTVLLEDYLKNWTTDMKSRKKPVAANKNNRSSERASEILSTDDFQESNRRSDSSDGDLFHDKENSSHVRQRRVKKAIRSANLVNLSNKKNLNKRESSKQVALDEDAEKIDITPPTIRILGAEDANELSRTPSDCKNRDKTAKTRLNHPTEIIGSLSEKDGPLHTLTDVDSQLRVENISPRKLRTRSSFKKEELTEETISKEIENTPKPNSSRLMVKLKDSQNLVRARSPESLTIAISANKNTKSQSSTTKAAKKNTSKKRKSSEMSAASTSTRKHLRGNASMHSKTNIVHLKNVRIVLTRIELDGNCAKENGKMMAESSTKSKNTFDKTTFPFPSSNDESSSTNVILPRSSRSSDTSSGGRATKVKSLRNNRMTVEENLTSASQTGRTELSTPQQSNMNIANAQDIRIVANRAELDKNSDRGNQQTIAEASSNDKKLIDKRIFSLPSSDKESSSDDVILPRLTRSSDKSLGRRKKKIDSSQNIEMAVEESLASTSRTRRTKSITPQESSINIATAQNIRIVADRAELDKNSDRGNQETIAEASSNDKKLIDKRIFSLPSSDEESSSDDVILPRLTRSSDKSLGRGKTKIDSLQNIEMAVEENPASTSRTRRTKSITPQESSINMATAQNIRIVADRADLDQNSNHENQRTVAETSTSRSRTFDRRILFFSSSDEESSSDNIISSRRTRLSGKISKRQTTEVDSSQNDEMTAEGNVVFPKASTGQTQRMKSSKSQQSTLNTVNLEVNRITPNQAKLQKNSVRRTQQTIVEASTSRSKTYDQRRLFLSSSEEESSLDAIFTPKLARSSDKVSQSQATKNNGSRSNEITLEKNVASPKASTSKMERIHSNIPPRSHVYVTSTKNIDAFFATKPLTDEIVSIEEKSENDMKSQAKKKKSLTRNHSLEESTSDDSESDRGKNLSKDETREKSSSISNSRVAFKNRVFHLESFNDNEDSFLKSLDTITSVPKENADEQSRSHSRLQNASRSLSEKERAKYLKNWRRNQNIVFKTQD